MHKNEKSSRHLCKKWYDIIKYIESLYLCRYGKAWLLS